MKKGLLSLFVVALTIVSCAKNYDSKFDELNVLLKSQVTDMNALKTQVTALQSTVTGLDTAIKGIQTSVGNIKIPDNSADFTKLSDGLTKAQTTIDALTTQLNTVVTSSQLASVTAAISNLQTDVTNLLKKNAVVNQPITINNMGTLQLAESLVGTKTDDPAVIVNGNVVINSAFANDNAALTARINTVTNKIASVITSIAGQGLTVTSSASSTVDFNALTSINGVLNVQGREVGHPKLSSLSGLLTIGYAGAVNYATLTNIGSATLHPKVTSVNFGTAQIGAISTTGSGSNVVYAPFATSFVAGTGNIKDLRVAKATTVTFGSKTEASVNILAPVANSKITYNGTTITGDFTVVAHTGSTLEAPNLTTLASATSIGSINTANFPKLSKVATTTIAAGTVTLPALTSNVSGTITLARAAAFNSPSFVAAKPITLTAATSIIIGSTTDALLLTKTKATALTLSKQAVATSFDSTAFTALVTLNVTGATTTVAKANTVANTMVASGTSLTTVNITGAASRIGSVTIGGVKVNSVTTAGEIARFELRGTKLVTGNFAHGHLAGGRVAELIVANNPLLTSLTTTKLNYVGAIDITSNAKLASLNLASLKNSPLTSPPTGYVVAIHTNKLTGVYVNAVALTTSTPYVEAQIQSNDLNTLTPFFTSSNATAAATHTLNINLSDVVAGSTTRDLTNALSMDSAKNTTGGVLGSSGARVTTTKQFVALVKPE